MKTIRTAGSSFLTGTEIADAVMAYGLALARVRELDIVDIPFVTADGAITRAEFRIGWLIDTVITTDEQGVDELMDVNTIFGLLAKTRSLTPSHIPMSSHKWTASGDDANWDELI